MTTDDDVAGYRNVVTGERDTSEATGAARVRGSAAPELKSLLSIAVGTLVIAALYFGQEVLIPITLAVMLSFVLSPLVDLLQRLRLWRGPAVMATVLAALGVLGLVGALIGNQAAALSANAPAYAQTIEKKIAGAQSFAVTRIASITRELGGGRAPPPAAVRTPAQPLGADAGPQRRPVLVEVANERASPLTIARTILAPILGPLETLVIVLIVAIFVLMQKEDLRDRFIRVFGSSDLHRTTMAMDDAGKRLSRYFLSQLAVNTSFGIVIGLGLWLIGVPSPAMWGVLAGLLRFVPYIGSFLAAIAPIALGAAIDPGWGTAIEVAALFILVEPLTGYVVEPLLYGHSTGLSPVSVIVAAIFWTWLWGPIGLIMSTPLTLCLVVLGRHVKSLEFFDVLLGDRPALNSVDSFYQRILANNPDEALAQAEQLIEGDTLVDYYDNVVLEGLKLAAQDEARGTIDRARAAQMTRSMLSVIDDMKDHVAGENDAPSVDAMSRQPADVMCVSGHGPFDDAVSAMLIQLLAERGVTARMIPNAAVAREAIDKLDVSDVGVIAISYLQVTGSPAPLRYLIKRLRDRAPDAQIIVGLWPQGEAALSDPSIQGAVGADAYVGTLSDARDRVLADQLSRAPHELAVAVV